MGLTASTLVNTCDPPPANVPAGASSCAKRGVAVKRTDNRHSLIAIICLVALFYFLIPFPKELVVLYPLFVVQKHADFRAATLLNGLQRRPGLLAELS